MKRAENVTKRHKTGLKKEELFARRGFFMVVGSTEKWPRRQKNCMLTPVICQLFLTFALS
jgi:hypothetical protein